MSEGVDVLVKNAVIVTMDSQKRVFEDGALAVRNNRILAVGKTVDLEARYKGDKLIDGRHHAVIPGLIDCHAHVHQQFLRTAWWIDTPALPVGWHNFLMPFEGTLSPEDAQLGAQLSCVNMIKSGTTCFADAGGSHPDELARAVEKTGMRAVIARSTADMGEGPELGMKNMVFSTKDAIRKNVELVEKWNNTADGRIRAWFGLRQIMVCSEELWEKFKELSEHYKTGIHTHLAELPDEVVWTLRRWGKRPVERLYDTGFLGPNILFAHMVYLTDRELSLAAERKVKIAHCPVGILQRISRPTKVPQMLALGITVGLGTDGAALRSLDMFQEMMVAGFMHRGQFGSQYEDTVAIPSDQILSMTTIDAAKALLWDNELGSLEPGKLADFVMVNLNAPHLTPAYRLYPLLVYFAKGSDVDTVVINGRVIMEGRHLTTIDEDEVLGRARNRSKQLIENINKIIPTPIREGPYPIR
jgi:5-methylthioadenosine/S-adenosylhomocysteine deaminase